MRSKKEHEAFLKLQKEWYGKIAKKGFKDLEDKGGNLKRYEANHFTSLFDYHTFKTTERYYQLAGQLLKDYPFMNERDRTIWEEHAKGANMLEIERKLKINRRYITSLVERVSRWLRV